MARFFKWLKVKLKKLGELIASRTFLFFAFVLIWIIPIMLLGSQIAFTKTISTTWKFTFAGLLVIGFFALKFYGKIKAKINEMRPETKSQLTFQIILIFLQRAISLTVWFFILKYLSIFSALIYNWFAISLIFIGFGVICYVLDKIIMYFKHKRQEKLDREKLKEEIKGEIEND